MFQKITSIIMIGIGLLGLMKKPNSIQIVENEQSIFSKPEKLNKLEA